MKGVTLSLFLLVAFTLALPSAGEPQSRQVLEPSDNCTRQSATAIVTFADSDLEEVVRAALSVEAEGDLTCGKVAELTQLTVPSEAEWVVYGGTLRPSPEKPFESLEGIQNLSNLTDLGIMNRLITDIGPLSELTNLRFLNLHTNWISDISPLSELTNLEQLIISENPIADLNPVRGLTKLTRLQVHGLYPYQLEHFLAYDDGRDPNVVFNGITDLSPLTGLTELRLLRIHLNNISDISPLAGLTNLTHLRIYDNKITDISPLRGLTKLKLLWAHNNEISDISALGGMTELLQLSLANNKITDISALNGLTSLEHLFLENNSVAHIGPLSRLQNIVVLHLDNNAITDVRPLQNLSKLRELGLAHNNSLHDIQPLLANEGIGRGDELDLRYTYVRCLDMDAFESRGVALLRATAVNGSGCGIRRLEEPPEVLPPGQSAQSSALAFPSDESYLRLLAPGNETYQVVDGSRMKRLVAEQAAIARRYRDSGHQYWGRILGTEADDDTASWMADQLRQAGAENVRLEPIDLPPQWIPRSWEVSAALAGEMATLTSAWPTYASPGTPSDGIEVELVDVGLGMETDFRGRDVRGKAVVIHSIPRPGVIQHSAAASGAIERADARGAAAILVVVEIPGNPQFALYEVNSSVPTLALGSADGAILQRMLSEANPQRPARLRLRLEVEEVDGLRTASVRGEVPAAAEDAERIVIVAHRDAFFEGASDNASGVATAVELMRYFAQVPRSQRRRTFEVIGSPGHHNLARTGFVWLFENRGTLLERVALLINAEHSSQALVDRWGAELRPTNSLGPFTWRIHGSSELLSIANRAFDEFGIPRWSEMGGPEGEIARVRTLVPSIVLMHAGVLMHSNIETAEAVPEAGLAATARAYAKIIDQANQLDLAQLVPRAP